MLVEQLLKENHKKKVLVYAIAGMGGIGKTTLAWKIFKDEKIQTSFSQIPPAWVDIPKDYDEEVTGQSVLKKIIMDFVGDQGEIQNWYDLPNKLRQLVTGKKFFLVLNDVWTTKVWVDLLESPLRNAAPGSRILVTTRDRDISRGMNAERCHEVQKLSPEDSTSLLRKMVLQGGDERRMEDLEHIGTRILEKCDGLPLALKKIGRVLKVIPAEWKKVAGGWSFEELEDIKGIGTQVMKELYTSYEDLPSQQKQCFVYCAMFPEDYILGRDMLLPLWIAEGFIKDQSNGSLMEDKAEEYWKQLVDRSLLQADHPGCYDQGGCKMHRVVRSVALYLAQGEYFSGDVQEFVRQTPSATSSSPKRRRVLIKDAKGDTNLDAIEKSECLSLRTVIFLDTPLLPEDFLKKFPFVRVLDLGGAQNSKLPDSVQYLIHLRYLNLSRSRISEIPNTIRRLGNLQFLGLAECGSLRILSDAILELRNLRALDVDGTPLEGMPKRIGKLQKLTRLAGFRVNSKTNNADSGGAEGGEEGQDGRRRSWCTLEELEHLTELKFLKIKNLERISSVDEAERAELSNKSHLDDLRLICNPDQQAVTDEEKRKIKEVFDKLCPPSSLQRLEVGGLQRLEVGGYFGLEYPVWMMDGSIGSHLAYLRHLELRDCFFCQTLPPLGLLRDLEILHISGAAVVKSIKNSFLLGDAAAAGQGQQRFTAFPKLKQLVLKDMDGWKNWLWEEEEEEDPAIVLLPLLEELVIERCNKLMSLPERLLHNVTRLTIEDANSLREIGNLPSVRTLKIAARRLVRIYNLPALENLTIVDCYELREVSPKGKKKETSEMKYFELQYLKLEDQIMISLPNWLSNEKEKEQSQSLTSGDPKIFFASGQDSVAVRKLEFICSFGFLRMCIEGGPEWPKIQEIPHVQGYNADKSMYISYDKSNPGNKFRTNIKKEEITSARTADRYIGIKRTTIISSDLASPFSIVILFLLVVGVAKFASDCKSFLLPFLLKVAAAIQKFK